MLVNYTDWQIKKTYLYYIDKWIKNVTILNIILIQK